MPADDNKSAEWVVTVMMVIVRQSYSRNMSSGYIYIYIYILMLHVCSVI